MAKKSPVVTDLFGNPWEPPRDPRGRRRHKPSPQGRENVALLKAGGASDEDIALQCGLSVPTLRKYYFRELESGVSLAKNELLKVLYEKAKGGNVSAIKAYLAEAGKAKAFEAMRKQRAPQESAAAPKAEERVGKKEQRQQAAAQVGGLYAPGAAPPIKH
jgi:hypothetical protein